MGIQQFKDDLTCHCNDMRRLQYLIDLPGFDEIYSRVPDQVSALTSSIQTNLDYKVRERSLEELRVLIRRENQNEETLEELRQAAAGYGIPRYSRMDKMTLLSAVLHRRNYGRKDQGNLEGSDRHSGHPPAMRVATGSHSLST